MSVAREAYPLFGDNLLAVKHTAVLIAGDKFCKVFCFYKQTPSACFYSLGRSFPSGYVNAERLKKARSEVFGNRHTRYSVNYGAEHILVFAYILPVTVTGCECPRCAEKVFLPIPFCLVRKYAHIFARLHGEQSVNSELFKLIVAFFGHKFGEYFYKLCVCAYKSLVYGKAYCCRGKGFADRVHCMRNIRRIRICPCLKGDLAVIHDHDTVDFDIILLKIRYQCFHLFRRYTDLLGVIRSFKADFFF